MQDSLLQPPPWGSPIPWDAGAGSQVWHISCYWNHSSLFDIRVDFQSKVGIRVTSDWFLFSFFSDYRPRYEIHWLWRCKLLLSLLLRVTQESVCWSFARSAVPEDISWRNADTRVLERSTKKLDISLFSKSGYLSSLPAASSSDGSVLRYHFPHSSPPYIPIPKQVKGVCVQKRERERERYTQVQRIEWERLKKEETDVFLCASSEIMRLGHSKFLEVLGNVV